ncbi:MAG TPA: hypothetical protein VF274_02030 [Alphaproteobacteria bacterium]|jgi:hypothetical protein
MFENAKAVARLDVLSLHTRLPRMNNAGERATLIMFTALSDLLRIGILVALVMAFYPG